MTAKLRLCALGDISFEGPSADRPSVDRIGALAPQLRESDLTIANLECVLARTGRGLAGKCTLRGSPDWAPVLRDAGIGLVTLANNHIMDYGPEGLEQTLDALRLAGIRYVGAGRNRREAHAPLVMEIAGRRVAFLGRSAVIVSAPTYATDDAPGVAFLDEEETVEAIRSARGIADLVVLLVHWGIEEYSYPTPSQRRLARRFVEAGADAVLGHHPHVLQGFELVGNAPVVYSLGNFAFDEFEWSYAAPDGSVSRQLSPLSEENRKGAIATVEWNGQGAPQVAMAFTRIAADGRVVPDADPARAQEMDRLSARLHGLWYPARWRLYSLQREWQLRLGERMSLRYIVTRLHKVRPRHIVEALTSLRRSARIVTERSSNPYE